MIFLRCKHEEIVPQTREEEYNFIPYYSLYSSKNKVSRTNVWTEKKTFLVKCVVSERRYPSLRLRRSSKAILFETMSMATLRGSIRGSRVQISSIVNITQWSTAQRRIKWFRSIREQVHRFAWNDISQRCEIIHDSCIFYNKIKIENKLSKTEFL